MKSNAEEVTKAVKGLAIAAARARELVKDGGGKDQLLAELPRRQKDIIRQHLLEIESDVATTIRILTGSEKS